VRSECNTSRSDEQEPGVRNPVECVTTGGDTLLANPNGTGGGGL
jgi:hypothetical protein